VGEVQDPHHHGQRYWPCPPPTAGRCGSAPDDHTAGGRRLLTHPNNPIAYLSWLLNQAYLTDRPCSMEAFYAAYEAELAAQRRAAAPTQRTAVAARAAGRAALHGEAHQQVRDILAQRARAAAAGKAEQIRAENAPPAQSSSPAAAAPGEHHPPGGAVAAG